MQFYAYRAKFDFHPNDEASLDISIGDIVLGSEKSLASGKWILVQKSTPPFSHGYVPSHYLERAQKEACFGNVGYSRYQIFPFLSISFGFNVFFLEIISFWIKTFFIHSWSTSYCRKTKQGFCTKTCS